jgi:hypothetical protein
MCLEKHLVEVKRLANPLRHEEVQQQKVAPLQAEMRLELTTVKTKTEVQLAELLEQDDS